MKLDVKYENLESLLVDNPVETNGNTSLSKQPRIITRHEFLQESVKVPATSRMLSQEVLPLGITT